MAFNTLGITYEATPAPATALQQEVNIFARDPREYADTLASFLTDSSAWDEQTGPCALPLALSLKYPGLANPASVGLPNGSAILTSTFFPNCPNTMEQNAILSSIAGPNGFGSIRAANMNDRGVCAASFDLGGVLPALQSVLWTQFNEGIQAQGQSCVDAEQQWFNGGTFLSENPNLNPDIRPAGGFNVWFYLDYPLEFFQPQGNIWGNFSSTWGLNDGLLAVSTVANGTKWNGKGSDSTSSSLYGDITGQLPTAIEEVALALQSVAIAPQATCTPTTITPSNGLPTTFTVATTGAQFTYTPVAISDSGVGDVLLGLDIALKNASTDGTFATLGLTNAANVSGASALDILQGTLAEPDPANANVYHNWICVQTQGGGATNGSGATWVPYYIARARRLNSYPDSVELVWTDDLEIEVGPLTNYCCANRCGQTPTSCATTSALPLYVLLEDQFLQSGSAPGGSAGQSLAKLCTASALAQATRQFYTFHSGHMYHSYQNVVNCAANQIGDFFSNQPGWATALTIGLCAAFTTNPTCGLL